MDIFDQSGSTVILGLVMNAVVKTELLLGV